ncbi:hypothetical protein [Streptomyces sp. JW3]|uniref:hypothetical protein n=1 Tax=Streptomyces sp. JW3 TaxID=3456955 RepID=UPI003FA4208A
MVLAACDVVAGGGDSAQDLLKPSVSARPGGAGGAVLGGADVDGFTVGQGKPAEVGVEVEVCAPLGRALAGAVVGERASVVVRDASGEGAVVRVVVAEYEGGEAAGALDAIGVAFDGCVEGFRGTVDGERREFEKVTAAPAPDGTDQAVGLKAGDRRAFVLRVGDTVAYLSGTPDVPDALLDAQLLKLRG